MRCGIKGLLLKILIVVLLGTVWGFCDDKYDGGSFILSPSKAVFHKRNGDLSYTIPSEDDAKTLTRVIQILNVAEKTQQTKWLTIQRKIALCNDKSCGDTLTIDIRENDSLLVKASLEGKVYGLVKYGNVQRMEVLTDQSYFTFKDVSVLLASTFSIWGLVLVGIIGFVKSRGKETFMWSAFFGGPIISYLTHIAEIRKTGKSYFWVVLGVCFLPRLLARKLCDRIDGYALEKLNAGVNNVGFSFYTCSLSGALIFIGIHLFVAFVATRRYEMICLNFDKAEYRRNEVKGVIAGIGFAIILNFIDLFWV